METIPGDPAQALALLPLDQDEEIERQWLQSALAWLKGAPVVERTQRLRQLADNLRKLPGARERFQKMWSKACPARLLADAGFAEATSLARELVARLKRRMLPQVEDELDLYEALHVTELDAGDADWITSLEESDVADWTELLGDSTGYMLAAMRLLAARVVSLGSSRNLMKVMPHRCAAESPFLNLLDATNQFARDPGASGMRDELKETIFNCRVSAGISHARLEETGVSSDLVFRLDLILAQLERMDALVRVHAGEENPRTLAATLVRGFAEERGIRHLTRNSVNRVARQIVRHTGRSGEHYIATSKSEWWKMGYGAVGAGGITAFTALFKYMLAAMALAPMWIGIAHSVNYTVSFVMMQLLGWRLASKMPSMTAAALSGAMEKDDGMRSEVNLVTAIIRTQTIVTMGNLLGAIPASMLIDALIQFKNGNPFLTHEAAMHGITSMHPWRSLTIPFAALTGCFLWLSSLAAGWTANWVALHRLRAGLAQNRRLRQTWGAERTVELASLVEHHLSGIIGYVCLGLLLGLVPFVSVFAGIPLEVRHITLASASLAYDVSSLAWSGSLPWRELAWAMLGLAATGILNLSVSFALGLWLAMRARNLGTKGRRRLVGALGSELWRHPARFLWRYEPE